ncbi:putative nuclease HARBI1 [Haliotis rufescens]|uniref:putative nuclease HARBI1 n=1 Tax=Haliotis rufescens TaxID=6454 RepID=UPI00201E8D9B|nr:putative nuclease HARBI1 [Haliotis rufescens]
MAEVVRLMRRLRAKKDKTTIHRTFRDRFNPLDLYNDEELFERYRFRRCTIFFIVGLIGDELAHPTQRSHSLPPIIQVLIFLQFVATGAFHLLVAQSFCISKATAGRCVRRVAELLCRLSSRFIAFPTGQRSHDVKRTFHAIAGFPNVLGCVDGTQIKIQTPKVNEADFVNRKGYHSLNVQMVCDPNFIITNCVANWPGSCHDARIFRESKLCDNLENGVHDGFLLGDSGYPCRRYLMTPYHNTGNIRHRDRYNYSLCRTRVLIEQTFGILKRRFPCLSLGLRTNPTRACKYVVSCAILHNIRILKQDIVINHMDELTVQGPDQQQQQFLRNDGFGIRDHIAQSYFSKKKKHNLN